MLSLTHTCFLEAENKLRNIFKGKVHIPFITAVMFACMTRDSRQSNLEVYLAASLWPEGGALCHSLPSSLIQALSQN